MDKIQKKTTLKIVAATSMCIFSLAVVFTGSIAWFESVRKLNNEQDNFQIENITSSISNIAIYDFVGVVNEGYFAFNANSNHSISPNSSGEFVDNGSFVMDTFSMTDQHHPVLFVFTVSGNNVNVNIKTTYPYLAIAKPTNLPLNTYASYADYRAASKTTGYYQISNDENQNGVDDDNKISTQYYYDNSTGTSSLAWVDLAKYQNPLSSVISSNYVLFSSNPADITSTRDVGTYILANGEAQNGVIYYTRSGSPGAYVYTVDSLLEYGDSLGDNHYVLSSSQQTYFEIDSNFDSPATSFWNNGAFSQEISLYSNSSFDKTIYPYIGIVIDYNVSSLEYIYDFFLGNTKFTSLEWLDFKCDWSMEI